VLVLQAFGACGRRRRRHREYILDLSNTRAGACITGLKGVAAAAAAAAAVAVAVAVAVAAAVALPPRPPPRQLAPPCRKDNW